MPERYICIHGHFYQPPRENPWLETIELQDSALPYHDWNERITAQCYATNAASRILDNKSRILKIVNNYAKISFNVGPTLLSWLEKKNPDVYRAILDADKESQKLFGGYGSALAQAYNHMILPLANTRDKETQVIWGIKDFSERFGRAPEGMWLPETAVDTASLEALAAQNIRFTILAPHQAKTVRKIGTPDWIDVTGGKIDPSMAYECVLPSGRKIVLFFYDGPISRSVAFEQLLTSGEEFSRRLLGAFDDQRLHTQLVHIATDGETYGHHHLFGDMALAYAIHDIEMNEKANLINYGAFLEKFPPTHEVQIIENTSWSCAHGVERWKANCGCRINIRPDWNQEWRAPLREALDGLRDALVGRFEEKARTLLKDPWAARNDYIRVLLAGTPEETLRFLGDHAAHELSDSEKITALKLMELERQMMLMYTSCGWFFDDLSGIETVQVIQYGARAIQLAEELFGERFEPAFLDDLSRAKSNIADHGDGRRVYEKFVRPAAVDLVKVGAHYALSSLFRNYADEDSVYCYRVRRTDEHLFESGKTKLVVGSVEITSRVTWESASLAFGALYMGDHNLNGGVTHYRGDEAYRAMLKELSAAFSRADHPGIIRLMDKHFGASSYSLKYLFKDEQRMIVNQILESTFSEAEAVYQSLYENRAPLMRFFADLAIPVPKAFRTAAEFVLTANIRRVFEEEPVNTKRARTLLEEARQSGVALEGPVISYVFQQSLERAALKFSEDAKRTKPLEYLDKMLDLMPLLPDPVNLWKVQNVFYRALQSAYPKMKEATPDAVTKRWLTLFRSAGEKLMVKVE